MSRVSTPTFHCVRDRPHNVEEKNKNASFSCGAQSDAECAAALRQPRHTEAHCEAGCRFHSDGTLRRCARHPRPGPQPAQAEPSPALLSNSSLVCSSNMRAVRLGAREKELIQACFFRARKVRACGAIAPRAPFFAPSRKFPTPHPRQILTSVCIGYKTNSCGQGARKHTREKNLQPQQEQHVRWSQAEDLCRK